MEDCTLAMEDRRFRSTPRSTEMLWPQVSSHLVDSAAPSRKGIGTNRTIVSRGFKSERFGFVNLLGFHHVPHVIPQEGFQESIASGAPWYPVQTGLADRTFRPGSSSQQPRANGQRPIEAFLLRPDLETTQRLEMPCALHVEDRSDDQYDRHMKTSWKKQTPPKRQYYSMKTNII